MYFSIVISFLLRKIHIFLFDHQTGRAKTRKSDYKNPQQI